MTTVILAEKPSQARSYVQAFQKSTKNRVTIWLATLFCPRIRLSRMVSDT
ncbi:DNA topoisomerase III [Lactiplantibacillus plantarum]|nr:DNA topoisomerase III [Lactiplantibacillus plantarum]MCG0647180.1 DNA topoisomerase III [Lactiplantibacillus plantarum]MCG0684276.1 DNA topoisomerase III [Lactiplantibacillus plantarum]MCG0785762.1 DNA topoisomerase III [Lactiplantibacillus plantarum]MCG0800932.1 DNA topoisomerase III [Lactiplantibacillus plantarum]